MATVDPASTAPPRPRVPTRHRGTAGAPHVSVWTRMVARWRMPPETLDDYDARQW